MRVSYLLSGQVRVSYLPSDRTMVVKGLVARPASRYGFKLGDGSTTTVEVYFRKTHNIQLKHASDWPCVMVSKTAAIPMELCT